MSEYYEVLRNRSAVHSDRYKNCSILKDVSTGESILSTREIEEIPSSSSDTYHRVQSHEIYRLDIIAHNYYKNPLLWWVIAQANGISDPFLPLEPGTLLRIPHIETLYGNRGILL